MRAHAMRRICYLLRVIIPMLMLQVVLQDDCSCMNLIWDSWKAQRHHMSAHAWIPPQTILLYHNEASDFWALWGWAWFDHKCFRASWSHTAQLSAMSERPQRSHGKHHLNQPDCVMRCLPKCNMWYVFIMKHVHRVLYIYVPWSLSKFPSCSRQWPAWHDVWIWVKCTKGRWIIVAQ